ncbi:MAG: cupin domain-containing protein [Robiginitomaculum sp.]|nr:cupin domain-containing protein [Robiginitomaculum sp.]
MQMNEFSLGPGAIEWGGTFYRTILSTEATGNAMSIVDSVSPPDSGPPRHVHDDADEAFVILTGDCEFWIEGERFTRGPGQSAFIPHGKEHTFRIVSTIPCRHLVILTPGGLEGFFEEVAAGKYRIPDDMAKIDEIANRFHMKFTGPPLGASDDNT